MNKRQNSRKEKIIAQFKPAPSPSSPIQELLSKQSQRQALMVGVLFVCIVALLGYNAGQNTQAVKGTSTNTSLSATPTSDLTQTWNQYSSACGIIVKFPTDWNVQKYFIQDSPDWCAFLTAPDYVQNFDSRSGFFVSIQKTEQGSNVNGIVINSLDDIIAVNQQSSAQAVNNNQQKQIGMLKGIQFDPVGYEQLTSFIFQHKTTFYQVSWPSESVSSGSAKKFVDPMLRTLRFK